MQLFTDFLPIVLFFISYKFFGIYIATAVAMVAGLLQIFYYYKKNRKIDNIQLASLVIILVLGSATIFFHNEQFIKWKPTALNLFLAGAFLLSHFIGEKPLIQRLFANNLSLSTILWKRLNFAWCAFFTFLGLLNMYVVHNFDTDVWVNFKLFGILGLTFIFIILQSVWLLPHLDKLQKNSTHE